jgi:hypothetical protein
MRKNVEQNNGNPVNPGRRTALMHDMDDLDLRPLVCDRTCSMPCAIVTLSRLVRRHADADPHEDHHQQGHHCYASTHVCLLVSRLTPRWWRDVNHL